MNVLKAQNDVLHSEVIKLQNEVSNLRRISNGVTSDVNKVTNVALSASFGTLSEGQQVPVNCIRYENGCRKIIRSYYTEYTPICEPCTTFLKRKLKTTPYSHWICPCCHQATNGPPLTLCRECMQYIQSDGWTESGFGSWHLDRITGEVICISLDFCVT